MNLLDRFEQIIPNYFDCEITREDNNFLIDECLNFYLIDNYIYLEYLHKCKYSGTESLKRLELLCRNFPEIKYIELEDASLIGFTDSKGNIFEYSLSLIYIMSCGMTWYNKHGYYQKTFQQDCINYSSIIDKNFFFTFKHLYDNIYELKNDDLDYLFYGLKDIYYIINNIYEQPTKYKVIKRCFEFLFDNYSLLMIDYGMTIQDVGQIIKNSKDVKIDKIIYSKDIILTIIALAFRFRFDDNNDNGINLIKMLN